MIYERRRTATEHRPNKLTFNRYCTCGLRWPCIERKPYPGDGQRRVAVGTVPVHWNNPTTLLYPIGRAGTLTRAQAFRAQGHRARRGFLL